MVQVSFKGEFYSSVKLKMYPKYELSGLDKEEDKLI